MVQDRLIVSVHNLSNGAIFNDLTDPCGNPGFNGMPIFHIEYLRNDRRQTHGCNKSVMYNVYT